MVALVMASQPDVVALFFALTSLPTVLLLLPADPRAWSSAPPIPRGTPLCLPPSTEGFSAAGAQAGLAVHRLPAAHDGRPGPPVPDDAWYRCSGFVCFSSGSTGPPKPVFRSAAGVRTQAQAIVDALRLQRGDGVLGTLPLAAGFHGLVNSLLVPALLGGELALVERFDHRTVLRLFALRRHRFWPATPLMADLLSRCTLTGNPPPAPPICKTGGGDLSAGVRRRFRERFATTLRASYGTAELGIISLSEEHDETDGVGSALPGVEVRIGSHPTSAAAPGESGRIWVRSPWASHAYGFGSGTPPLPVADCWHATEDIGRLDGLGRLAVLGRADDCIKTSSGYVVSLDLVARVLAEACEATSAVALPLAGPGGASYGILVERTEGLRSGHVHEWAARLLPAWSQPQLVRVVSQLPRLPSGKIDRAGCRELMGRVDPGENT